MQEAKDSSKDPKDGCELQYEQSTSDTDVVALPPKDEDKKPTEDNDDSPDAAAPRTSTVGSPPSDSSSSRCKIFISYSHKDSEYRDRLEIQLQHLQTQGYVDCWSDNKILPGMDWYSCIQDAMESCNVFLLLISPDFIASEFICKKEVPYATTRANNGSALLLSIVVRAVNWMELPNLNKFQALPTGVVPVRQWEDQDQAWLDVELGLLQALRSFSGSGGSTSLIDTFVTLATPAVQTIAALSRQTSRSSIILDSSQGSLEDGRVPPSMASRGLGGSTSNMSNSFSLLSLGGSMSSLTTTPTVLSRDVPLHFHCITDFWKRHDLNEGKLVSLKCTLSRYTPMVIGSPFKKRDAHLQFRKIVSDPDNEIDDDMVEATLNSWLSFSAGQMVWSLDFERNDTTTTTVGNGETSSSPSSTPNYVFLGLYQGIVRNSIPLFVTQEYYKSVLEQAFQTNGKTFDAQVVGRLISLPQDFTALFADDGLLGTKHVRPQILNEDQAVHGILVDGYSSSSITYCDRTTYLDGDIWVAIQDSKTLETSIHARFCNLADEADIMDQVRDLKEELHGMHKYYEVVFQFDQLEKRFEGKQKVDAKDMFGMVVNRKIKRGGKG